MSMSKEKKKSVQEKRKIENSMLCVATQQISLMIKIHKMCSEQINIPMIFGHLDVC